MTTPQTDDLKTILVVEDSTWLISRILESLEAEGYLPETGYRIVVELTTAEEAIAAFKEYQDSICLIILDSKLQDSNGIELLDFIKRKLLPLPPTIAHSTMFNKKLCAAGATHEVLKGTDDTALIKVVRSILPMT